MRSIAVLALAALMTAGCAKKAAEAPAAAQPDTKPAAAAPASNAVPAAPQPQLTSVSGTVLETLDASDYTYLRLKTDTGESWAAVTKAKIAKGEKVSVVNAMTMDGFESKTLNRKFDKIVFGVLAPAGGAAPAGAVAPASMAMGHQPAADAAAAPPVKDMAVQHGQAAGGPPDAPDVKVPKADGANAKTVAELWAQRTSLKGKDVVVKAKVVKVTNSVMGKNWLHVRDGSGSKDKKDNDLTVTTDAQAKVGDVVTVS